MTTCGSDTRWALLATLLAVLFLPAPVALASQTTPGTTTPAQPASVPQDPEAEGDRAAPVLIGGEAVIWVTTGIGPYTPQFRANRISQRLHEAVHDRNLRDPTVTVTETEGSSELRSGPRLLMVTSPTRSTPTPTRHAT